MVITNEKKQVIMLPTNDINAPFCIYKGETKPNLNQDRLHYHTNQHLYILSNEEIKESDKPCWCYNSIKNTWDEDIIHYQGTMPLYHYKGFKKIIATTDKLIEWESPYDPRSKTGGKIFYVPQIPQTFIENYVEAGGIDWINIEYKFYNFVPRGYYDNGDPIKDESCYKYKLNLTSNNEVIITN